MKKTRKLIALLLGLALIFATVAACADGDDAAGGSGSDDGTGFIGIAMPTQSSQRWIDDGNNLVQQLQALGHRTILQYGEDVVADQVSQIENMIVQGVDILVIAAIDGGSLTGVLAQAAAAGITVIAYDRLIMDTPHVDYYTTFDNFAVGVLQATSILDGLGITGGATGPFNIELFGGSPDDNNAFFFYDGAMSVLQPYIDSGVLVVRSGQVGMDVVGTLGWAAERAQARMDDLLTAHYANDRVDAVLSPYDGLSIGILSALRGVGYGSAQPWPIVSGQDAEVPSVQSIINGEQFSTVFKDTRVLAESTVNIIVAVLDGRAGPVNDTTTYHNNVKLVPSFLSQSVSVTIDNWFAALIDTGYYTASQFTS